MQYHAPKEKAEILLLEEFPLNPLTVGVWKLLYPPRRGDGVGQYKYLTAAFAYFY